MHIIFDLDGTIVDSYPGIEKAFNSTIEELHCKIHSSFNLKTQIGKPLYDIFYEATKNNASSQLAVILFRQKYGMHHLSEFSLYLNVKQTLESLVNQGHHLYIVTNKAGSFANQIITIAGLSTFFKTIIGPEINQSKKKSELIDQLVNDYPTINKNNCIMVGDTRNDLEAVSHLNIPVFILLHGYGKKSDFKEQEISAFCNNFLELDSAISQRYANL